MTTLRPVGMVFTLDFAPDSTADDIHSFHSHRVHYRVVRHVECVSEYGRGTVLGEEVVQLKRECLADEEKP